MLVSSRVTLAVAPVSALMVTLLVVEAEESRFRMTGAESSLVTPPWLTFWPLSVAETVMLPSSQVPGIRHRDGGQKDRNQCQRNEPGSKFSDVHSVSSLQRKGSESF